MVKESYNLFMLYTIMLFYITAIFTTLTYLLLNRKVFVEYAQTALEKLPDYTDDNNLYECISCRIVTYITVSLLWPFTVILISQRKF